MVKRNKNEEIETLKKVNKILRYRLRKLIEYNENEYKKGFKDGLEANKPNKKLEGVIRKGLIIK